MVPRRAAGVVNRPDPVPGVASRGTADRLPKWAKRPRQGTYSPNGTRCTFSNRSTNVPSGPHATISLRKAVVDTDSVTPTTTVSYTHLRAHETRHDLVC